MTPTRPFPDATRGLRAAISEKFTWNDVTVRLVGTADAGADDDDELDELLHAVPIIPSAKAKDNIPNHLIPDRFILGLPSSVPHRTHDRRGATASHIGSLTWAKDWHQGRKTPTRVRRLHAPNTPSTDLRNLSATV